MKLTKSDTSLCEKDALQDMLDSEKALMSLYTTALYEGDGKNVRKSFTDNLLGVAENQYTLYQQMSARGYYEAAPAKKDMIDQANDMFKKQQKALKSKTAGETGGLRGKNAAFIEGFCKVRGVADEIFSVRNAPFL